MCVLQTVISRSGVRLPHLPLPCIHSAATRVYFGHERRLAEGKVSPGSRLRRELADRL